MRWKPRRGRRDSAPEAAAEEPIRPLARPPPFAGRTRRRRARRADAGAVISATDTNILLDLLQPQGPRVEEAERTLDEARRAGALIVCEAVYAEVAAHFGRLTEADLFF